MLRVPVVPWRKDRAVAQEVLREAMLALANGDDLTRISSDDAWLGVIRQYVARTVANNATFELAWPICDNAGARFTEADAHQVQAWILSELVARPRSVALAIAKSNTPIEYLIQAASNIPSARFRQPGWLVEEAGRANKNQFQAYDPLAPAGVLSEVEQEQPRAEISELFELADRACRVIVPRTPAPLRSTVEELVHWESGRWPKTSIALLDPSSAKAAPPTRSHDTERRREAVKDFPALNRRQIEVVDNVAWGGRPNPLASSLLIAFARDHDFQPGHSDTHFRALAVYEERMERYPRLHMPV